MMAAKSTTWSYLKRAWDNDLTFERASRSLAKTGFSGPPWRVKNHSVFDDGKRLDSQSRAGSFSPEA